MQPIYFIKPKRGTRQTISPTIDYPDPTKSVVQITSTGNPDYYGFGNGFSLDPFFPNYSIYIAKRGPSHYLDGGYWYGQIYNHITGAWGLVFTIKDTSPDILSGVSAGIVGNHIIIHGSRYTVSGGVDTFEDIGYIQSVDLTTISINQLTESGSWGAFTVLPAATYPRYEAYGKILCNPSDLNTGYSMWFEHEGGVTWRVNIRKFVDDGSGNLTITNSNIFDGTSFRLGEPQLLHCGGDNWLIFCRQNGTTSAGRRIYLFKSNDNLVTCTGVGVTNMGSGSGHCVVDALYVNDLVHVHYHDRGNGYVMQSINNSFATVSASATSFNAATQYEENAGTGSINGPGYPSAWVIRDTNIIYRTWIKEISTTECHVFGTLDQIVAV